MQAKTKNSLVKTKQDGLTFDMSSQQTLIHPPNSLAGRGSQYQHPLNRRTVKKSFQKNTDLK